MVEDNIKTLKEIKEYAQENNVPIIMDESLKYIINYINVHEVVNILEIGTAIGYSAIMMALINKNIKITSIEKDQTRYLEAIKNIKKMDLENQITLVFNDALETKISGTFDLIFIDAAKSKNIQFFNRFEKNLAPKGTIITDNLKLHGFVEKELETIKNRNLRALVRKIRTYINFLDENLKYKTKFYNVGDGLSVTERRNKK
jgi:predicted O-methyltransferase YrrM